MCRAILKLAACCDVNAYICLHKCANEKFYHETNQVLTTRKTFDVISTLIHYLFLGTGKLANIEPAKFAWNARKKKGSLLSEVY